MMDERKDNLPLEETAKEIRTEETAVEETAASTQAPVEDELFQYDDPKAKKKAKKEKIKKETEKDNRFQRGFVRKMMPLFVLVAAFAVLGGAYFALRSIAPEDNGEDKVNTIEVLKLNATEVKTVTVKNAKDNYEMYKKSGSVYKIRGKEDKPVDEDVISTSIGYLSDIKTTKKVMAAQEKLGDYGLAKPIATVTVTTNKKQVVLYVGNQNSEGGYYMYMKDDAESKDGKTAVYVLGETLGAVCVADRFYYYETDISHYNSSTDAENIS
ncbi:MAG: DUF4340 domain-containing protein, partial [Clostridia bacterium]|nr:DUF4340 domain-containing protein [Clostridia bacterium]